MSVREILAGRAVIELGLRSKLEAGLKAAQRRLTAFSANLSTVGRAFAGVGGASAATFGGLAGALTFPTMLAANLETATVAFETMLGSADKAKLLLGQLRDFAASTPLSFDEISDAAKKLLAFGVNAADVSAELRRVGDIASGIGAPIGEIAEIYGKAKVQGRLFAEDINQLTGRGIPIIQELAKQFRIAESQVKSLVESGSVNFGNLQTAFASMTATGSQFGGMMAKQAGTLTGLVSTLKDNVLTALVPIGQSVSEVLKPIISGLSALVQPITEVIESNAWLARTLAVVAGGGLAASGVLLALGGGLIGMGAVTASVVTITSTLGPVIAALALPFAGIATVLAATAAAAYYFRDAILSSVAPLAPAIRGLRSVIADFGSLFSQTFKGILVALESGNLAQAGKVAMAGLNAVFWQGVAGLGNASIAVLDMLSSWIPGFDSIRQYAGDAFASIGNAILAGRWDLAVSIVMKKTLLAFESGISSMRFAWTAFQIGLETTWDTTTFSLVSVWRENVAEIAKAFAFLGEQLGILAVGSEEEIGRMLSEDKRKDAQTKQARERERYDAAQRNIFGSANTRADQLRQEIAELERESLEAVDSAAPTLGDKAASARLKLAEAVKAASKNGSPVAPEKLDQLKRASLNSKSTVKQLSSTGTFSAAAVSALGVGSKPLEQTARNTGTLINLAKKQLKQRQNPPAFGV
jgi:tape measure domain-containing protein